MPLGEMHLRMSGNISETLTFKRKGEKGREGNQLLQCVIQQDATLSYVKQQARSRGLSTGDAHLHEDFVFVGHDWASSYN